MAAGTGWVADGAATAGGCPLVAAVEVAAGCVKEVVVGSGVTTGLGISGTVAGALTAGAAAGTGALVSEPLWT